MRIVISISLEPTLAWLADQPRARSIVRRQIFWVACATGT